MNREHTYSVAKQAKEKEMNFIKDTPHNSEYNINLGTRPPNQHKHNKNTDLQPQKVNWQLSHTAVKKQR
jgi:hypothetical protein